MTKIKATEETSIHLAHSIQDSVVIIPLGVRFEECVIIFL